MMQGIWTAAVLTLVPQATPPAAGDKAPAFSVMDVSGKPWTLEELQKRAPSGVVSLTFWCTFCHSCRLMDARFQTLADVHKGKAAVLGIDASAADTPAKIEAFAKEKKFTVPVFVDADGKAADLFGVRVTTTTLVLDKDGVIRYRGRFDGAAAAIEALLAGKEVAVKETAPAG